MWMLSLYSLYIILKFNIFFNFFIFRLIISIEGKILVLNSLEVLLSIYSIILTIAKKFNEQEQKQNSKSRLLGGLL